MTEVVVNRCYGGFDLSDEAIRLYAEKKGITLYTEEGEFSFHYTVPIEEYKKLTEAYETARKNYGLDDPKTRESMERLENTYFYDQKIKRDDPVLVEVVRELGEKADGKFAKLKIVEIPDDVKWLINECRGMEHVAEQHRTW